ncbi:MAG: short-chain dehydrogenase/reductase [Pseudomonadota bacterium]|nr:short-chain dehydrogenase/reductase [Pseudomonadota bacterium]
MDLGLSGKRVLITGASKGIGRAIAEVLAEEGCSLHLASRTEADLARARDEINEKHGVQVTIHPLDLSDGENAKRLAQETEGIDILVNNAGAIPGGDIEMVTEEIWREAWNLKVFGYINMCREVYPAMCKRGSGVIFNVVGMAGVGPRANYVAGSVGNAGLDALTVALGSESINYGVRVLGIHPGAIETERLTTIYKQMASRDLGDENRFKEMYKGLPADRPGTPEECATVAAVLISEKSYWLNGVVIPVNGRGQGW